MFDQAQVLNNTEYWSNEDINELETIARNTGKIYKLTRQLRMQCSEYIQKWLHRFIFKKQLDKLELNSDEEYDIQVFSSPVDLFNQIKEKAANKESSLSRIVATYDWDYNSNQKNKNEQDGKWYVNIPQFGFKMPWNYQAKKEKNRLNDNLSWPELDYTINEVGSTFSIQGFDLSYVGVIIGPSVSFRNGKVVIDYRKSCDKNKKNQRTIKNGKEHFGDEYIQNELNVLLTRGVKGLYIFAVDKNLNDELKKCIIRK
jgi:hypothetical protein